MHYKSCYLVMNLILGLGEIFVKKKKLEKKIGIYYGSKGAEPMNFSVRVFLSYQHIRVCYLFRCTQ